jgi:hypothetical protein
MVTHKADQCLAVSLTVADRLVPSLNPDPFINHEVARATDSRVFESPRGCWIYAEVSSVLTTLGESTCYNTKFLELQSYKLMRVVDS